MLYFMAFLSVAKADGYLTEANGDELEAALALAYDLTGGETPGSVEIHHALYLIRDAHGQPAASYDDTRVSLRDRGWCNETRIERGQP